MSMNQGNSKICEGGNTLIFPCSGAADVGEISDLAGRELTRKGLGSMFCLAGIGGNIPTIITKAKDAKNLLVIDGCPLDCARKTLEEKDIEDFCHFRVTDQGMEKSKSPATEERVTKIVTKAEELFNI